MPIRIQCPSCKTALGAPDGPPGQRVRCPFCGTAFAVKAASADVPAVAPAAPPPRQMLQRDSDYRSAPPRREEPPRAERPKPEVARRSSGLPVGLLIGAGVGVLGLLLLLAGAISLAWIFSSSDTPAPQAPPTEIAQANLPPGAEAARQNGAGPQVLPEAPIAADGREEFVDLPERGEDIPGVAGLNPDPPQNPGPASERPRVAITGGRAERRVGQPHTFFQINYRFVQGAPAAGVRYGWVIVTARGRSFKQSLAPGRLQQRGTLQGQAPIGISQLDRPYRTYLVIELPGLQEEKISDELILR